MGNAVEDVEKYFWRKRKQQIVLMMVRAVSEELTFMSDQLSSSCILKLTSSGRTNLVESFRSKSSLRAWHLNVFVLP